MGASGWFYEVTYREDVGSALNDLRADVFGRGEYFRSWEPEGLFAGMNREELLESCLAIADEIADSTESISGFADSVIALRAGGQPTTIDAARFLNLESGTHSILDCERVSDLPEFGAVARFRTPNKRCCSDQPNLRVSSYVRRRKDSSSRCLWSDGKAVSSSGTRTIGRNRFSSLGSQATNPQVQK
jgi:hypothetical protein